MKERQTMVGTQLWAAFCAAILAFAWHSSGLCQSALDPEKIVGPVRCGECHRKEAEAWEKTHHHASRQMHAKSEARTIATAMSVTRISRDSRCVNCHYTLVRSEEGGTESLGVSCESCHGAANDWINVHGDYGGKGVTREKETPGHKAERHSRAQAAGMIGPSEIYRLAQNCFECHTIPNEDLVNAGRHRPGSDFELVSWSQGEVRHNYSRSGGRNEPASAERQRELYVVGRMLDLEYSLRGMAKATRDGQTYAVNMAKRLQTAFDHVERVQQLTPLSEIGDVVAAVTSAMPRKADGKLTIETGQESRYLAASERVRQVAGRLAGHLSTGLEPLDALIPKEAQFRGQAAP